MRIKAENALNRLLVDILKEVEKGNFERAAFLTTQLERLLAILNNRWA